MPVVRQPRKPCQLCGMLRQLALHGVCRSCSHRSAIRPARVRTGDALCRLVYAMSHDTPARCQSLGEELAEAMTDLLES